MIRFLVEFGLIVCLSMAFLGDVLQSVSRVSASMLRIPDLSTHLTTLSMLINRFGAAIGLLLIGYSIDTGIAPHNLVATYMVTMFFVGGCYAFAAYRGDWMLFATARFVNLYYKVQPPVVPEQVNAKHEHTTRLDLTVIYVISVAGLLLPSVLASIFPAYRGTLLQSGFLLNSVATLYTALKIEKDIALDLISNNDELKWRSLVNFLMSRMYACLLAAGGFAVLFFVVPN